VGPAGACSMHRPLQHMKLCTFKCMVPRRMVTVATAPHGARQGKGVRQEPDGGGQIMQYACQCMYTRSKLSNMH
jgi:hypothetical protein